MEISSAGQAIISAVMTITGVLCYVLGRRHERAHPKTHTITLTQRLNDWHARVDGDGDGMMAGVGPTPQAAIGWVVQGYRNRLHIEIKP